MLRLERDAHDPEVYSLWSEEESGYVLSEVDSETIRDYLRARAIRRADISADALLESVVTAN